MTIQQIYDLGLKMAIDADTRGREKVEKQLDKVNKEYNELSEKKKKFFDKESLTNPYSDSRILYGDPTREIKKVIAGIDVDTEEILLADRLNQKGEKIDLTLTHHPNGPALAGLYEVMDLQVDLYADSGVPINVIDALVNQRADIVKRRFGPLNHSQSVDAARLLDLPYVAMHTFWDNLVNKYTKDYLNKREFDSVGELYDYICEIPEYQEGLKGKAGPRISSGSSSSRPGKILSAVTGGTNPSKELYVEMAKAGIGTVVDMHINEEVLLELKKLHINAIDLGHIPADSIGANLFLDELEKNGIEVVPFGGLIRVKRF